jgi:hypothetical protein
VIFVPVDILKRRIFEELVAILGEMPHNFVINFTRRLQKRIEMEEGRLLLSVFRK